MQKEKFERAIIDGFIKGQNVVPLFCPFAYILEEYRGKSNDAPDAILKNTTTRSKIGLEVTSAYYDQPRARGCWKPREKSPSGWHDSHGNPVHGPLPLSDVIYDPDSSLAFFVQNKINDKCTKDYGGSCILIVYMYSPLSDEDTIRDIREIVKIPERNPFSEIYVCLTLPDSVFSPQAGKFTFYRIYPPTDKLHNLDRKAYKQLEKQWEDSWKRNKKWITASEKEIDAELERLKKESLKVKEILRSAQNDRPCTVLVQGRVRGCPQQMSP